MHNSTEMRMIMIDELCAHRDGDRRGIEAFLGQEGGLKKVLYYERRMPLSELNAKGLR